ncbi:hypothetical protein GCM10023195_37440 [Actinoallomurus liliacearum]|uniref:Uncharacterized protein n=1 Tax=Actinoallomurus liliacearum TaxID=1080073 RepID=A0ABP8TIU5_9ACTN
MIVGGYCPKSAACASENDHPSAAKDALSAVAFGGTDPLPRDDNAIAAPQAARKL